MPDQDPATNALKTIGSIGGTAPADLPGAESVRCAVCDAMIDTETGESLSEVTDANVAAVQEYVASDGDATSGEDTLEDFSGVLGG